ncbi:MULTISPECIES: MFS transporter [Streptomyces]|uniref:MFS transporter n=1 Tax=Streptomyces TaxID=1883 RepID=UPI00081E7752|nr:MULTISPECIES: MFS transporter [unclassified Streptomyces]MBJ7004490.1 MFS transporter [Streptomyces sp. CRPSP2-6A1]MYQ94942.1 MFS transporter [Streptomyces sp. SID4946]SCF92557.1 Major Facilitator Superfamily protein [Streptomyces sp. DconLS]SCG00057.1 Major Facilitator Superfamily protein [Streptomyces sp. LamerLS-31b]
MDAPQPSRRTGGVVAALALAGTVAAIMQTLVTPLIAELPRILHTSSSNAAWVITVTLLVGGVCVPVSGRLGDLVGKRRMMLICVVPLVIGSVVCALSTSVVPMIVGRGLQGMGMGMIPLGIALLRDVLPAEKLSGSIALVSASMGIGGAIGLPLAAAVAQYADWQLLFWGSAALAVIVGVLIFVVVPDVPAGAKGQRFDAIGAIGLAIGLVALLLAISKGADWGWASGTTLALFAVAVLALPAWGRWELRTRDPLIDLRTTARPRVLITNAASVLIGVGMYSFMLIAPQLLQFPKATGFGLGQSMLAAGLWIAPGGIMMMVISPLGGKLINARGPKLALTCGAVVMAAGYALALPLMGTAWGIMLSGIVINSGVALAYGSMPALIMSSVPLSETAAANGFNTLMRSLGTTIGSAVIGVVLAHMTITLGGYTLASENGFRTGLLIGCGVALVSAAVASFIPAPRKPTDTPDPHPTEADPAPARP